MDTEDVSSTSNDTKAIKISWPSDDLNTLLNNIRSLIPPDDTLNYFRRLKKISWNQIAFKKYSGAECETVWSGILKNLRHHRVLAEILIDAEKWVSQPWTSFHSSKAKNRHPDLPKKPLAPSLAFLVDNKHIRKDFSDLKSFRSEMTKMYQSISKEEKEKYEKQYELDKEEYKRKMKLFLTQHPELKDIVGRKFFLKNKQENMAMEIFVKERMNNISKHDSPPAKELIAKFENEWDTLTREDKLIWFEKSKIKHPKTTQTPKVKGPARSVYSLFSRKTLRSGDLKSVPPKERMAKISELYKGLKPKQIRELELELKVEMENYLATQKAIEDETDSKPSKKKKKTTSKTETGDNLNFGNISVIDDAVSPGKKKKKDKNISKEEIHPDSPSINISTHSIDNADEKNRSKSKKKKLKEVINNEDEVNNSKLSIKTESSNSSRQQKEKRKIEAVSKYETLSENMDDSIKESNETDSGKKKRKTHHNSETDGNESSHLDTSSKLYPGEPELPPGNPFELFSLEKKNNKNKDYSEEKLLKKWSKLDSSVQKSYKKSLKQLNKEYTVNYEKFLLSLSKNQLRKYLKKKQVEQS